jgi:CRP-like cAMP-binding protein
MPGRKTRQTTSASIGKEGGEKQVWSAPERELSRKRTFLSVSAPAGPDSTEPSGANPRVYVCLCMYVCMCACSSCNFIMFTTHTHIYSVDLDCTEPVPTADEQLGKTLHTFRHGDFFGEVSVMINMPRTVSIAR